MNCVINTNNAIFKEVIKLINSNKLANDINSQVISNGAFSQEFMTWLNANLNEELDYNLNTTDENLIKKIAKGMIQYYSNVNPSVELTTLYKNVSQVNDHYGYSNYFARREGLRHVGTLLLDIYKDIQKKNIKITSNKVVYYTMRLQDSWLNILFDTISEDTKISKKDLKTQYENEQDKDAWLDKMLGGVNKTTQNANKLAVYRELFGAKKLNDVLPNGRPYNKKYIKEVLCNSILDSVRSEIYNLIDDKEQDDTADASDDKSENTDGDNGLTQVNDLWEGDSTFMQYGSHGGMYSSYLKHIGARIANYFNSLRKITSASDLNSFDTENSFGIAECMDMVSCSKMIYSTVNCNSVSSMIRDIRRIANQVPGFESFAQLAHDLETDLDFATEFKTVFYKLKMTKTEVVVEDGNVTVRQSNQNVDKNHVMINQMFSDISSTAINNNFELTKNILNAAINSLKNGPSDEVVNNTLREVLKVIRQFFPSIQNEAVTAYVMSNDSNKPNYKANNIRRLIGILNATNNATLTTKQSYNDMLYAVSQARELNREIRAEERKGNFTRSGDHINVSEIYSEGYLSIQHNKPITTLMQMLSPYSVISIDLNSRNIYGNNSSDIINNSYIGNLYHMTELFERDDNGVLHNDILLRWVKDKLKTNQYKYSNVFVEHKDEKGNIINYGLVSWNGDDYTLTDYADSLLKFSLFNGSSDLDIGSNVGYSKMTEGDYLPTSFMQTLNSELEQEEVENTPFNVGNYFLRTPSDAPKQFMARMPRYDASNLFIDDDPSDTAYKEYDIVQNYGHVIPLNETTKTWYNTLYPQGTKLLNTIPDGKLNEFVHPKDDIRLRDISKAQLVDKENEIYQVAFFDNGTGRIIILNGKIARRGDYNFLVDAEYKGIVGWNYKDNKTFTSIKPFSNNLGENEHSDTELYNIIAAPFMDQLKRTDITINDVSYKKINITINTNHPIYKILYNNFRQEVLDAAIAAHKLFEFTESGRVRLQFDKETNSLVPVLRDGVSINGGYNFYHRNGDKIYTVADGIAELTGNVFSSTKFKFGRIITDENNKKVVISRTYLNELIGTDLYDDDKGKINILYGGLSNTNLKVKLTDALNDADRKVIDVEFTSEQEAAIQSKLQEFIENYVAYVSDAVRSREEYISGKEVNESNVQEYAMNQFIAHLAFDELFEGNTKFYKDGRTVLKRAKQDQGSGISYGIANIENPNVQIEEITDGSSFLNSGSVDEYILDDKGIPVRDEDGALQTKSTPVQDILHSIGLNVTQRTGFRAVTVANSKNGRNATFDLLIDVLENNGLKRDKAEDLIYGPIQHDKNGEIKRDKDGEPIRFGGFTNTKVNDAQSYITYEEWIRRIAARGQLQRYLPLIKKIAKFDPAKPSTYLTASELNEFVQVQKNFYYDLIYDERYDMFVPRQIKNAEFVLIPQFIAGTQLENVYNLMKKLGIDQLNTVETSKAANETILNLWDNDGNISQEAYDKFEQDASNLLANGVNATTYWYNNLYTQQETPQHMNEHNKAGIQFLKKILDNIPETEKNEDGEEVEHHLQTLKREFFKVYTENIESSLTKLCDELNIPRDENGNIILDEEGKIQGLDEEKLYERFLEEFMRTGMDKNVRSYCEATGDNETKMSPVMNNIISKFESVLQSVFNHNITRQELPGFHAAQVTNVGFKTIREQGYEKGISPHITYDKKLHYHTDENGNYRPYIEIMVPLSWLGINIKKPYYKKFFKNGVLDREALLKELDSEGLCDIIGYRIPTEGKQSICNMKIVGLLDDSQGSTIVVPDEWVAQTGSDFDIDSIYTIQYNVKFRNNGKAYKVRYIEDNKTLDIIDYFNYLRRNTEEKSITLEAYNRVFNIINTAKRDLIGELPKGVRDNTIAFMGKIRDNANKLGYEGRESTLYKIEKLNDYIETNISIFSTKGDNYKPIIEELNKVLELNNDIKAYIDGDRESYSDYLNNLLNAEVSKDLNKLEDKAKEYNLFSYNDFISTDNRAKINSREARDNRILDICRTILSDPSSLEENLSRSNFEDIVRARNEAMSLVEKEYRESYSPYDVIAQIKYQDDAMSGADLKALSVTLDTFCSVCNTVKPYMQYPIFVVYSDGSTYNHDTYGWTRENNRNVVGKILTAYSSQTTALILDAIKEGNIPNVNTYSFGAFKTLVNIGVSYEAAIPFIMQPAIGEIIDNQKRLNSVFGEEYGNPIVMAIRTIAKKLDIINKINEQRWQEQQGNDSVSNDNFYPEDTDIDLMSFNDIMDIINELYSDKLNEIFKVEGRDKISFASNKISTAEIPLLESKIKERIQEQGQFTAENETRLLFDLGNVLLYNKLHLIASKIGDIARVCNPDKFGAKQTVYATRQVFNDIDRILFDREDISNEDEVEDKTKVTFVYDENNRVKRAKQERSAILYLPNGKSKMHILESIYPGCKVPNGDVEDVIKSILNGGENIDSSYPSLYAMLRCASITSVSVAKQVFDTQRPRFVKLVNGLSYVFSDNKDYIDEATYNDFQKYIISTLYNNLYVIRRPIKITKDARRRIIFEFDNDVSDDAEKRRIYGINYNPTLNVFDANGNFVPFTVADIANPTEEEMRTFEKFSPAQKIQWIKSNFKNSGIFAFIETALYNNDPRAGKKQSMQTLEFSEQNVNIDDIYDMFTTAFYNRNPLVVSAAIDIIKYAAQVEGFRMTKKGVMKVIDNEILLNDFGPKGLGFNSALQDELNNINNGTSFAFLEDAITLYENYLRSHPNCKGIRTVKLSNYKAKKLGLFAPDAGMYILHPLSTGNNNIQEFDANLQSLGIRYRSGFTNKSRSNKYVRLVRNGQNTLYKINDYGGLVILYPLTNLRTNETGKWSINNENNEDILSKQAYEKLKSDYITAFNDANMHIRSDSTFIAGQIAQYKKDGTIPDMEYIAPPIVDINNIPALKFSLEELAREQGGNWQTLYNEVVNHFSNANETNPYYTYIQSLGEYILSTGGVSPQAITLPDGRTLPIYIAKKNLNVNTKGRRTARRGEDKSFAEYYLRDKQPTTSIENPSLRKIIDRVKSYNGTELEDVYEIGINDGFYASEEVAYEDTIRFASSMARGANDQTSQEFMRVMDNNSIKLNNDSIKENLGLVGREAANYLNNLKETLNDAFTKFCPDTLFPNTYHNAISPEARKLIREDFTYEQKAFKLVNACNEFINRCAIYDTIDTDDTQTQHYINVVRNAEKEIRALPIDELSRVLSEVMTDRTSTNPLIKDELIDVMDGFWKTYGNMYNFNDIAENGTPILQLVYKEVNGYIEAARLQRMQDSNKYWKNIRKIQEDAKARGLSVDIQKIIDAGGRFVQEYTSEFADKFHELASNLGEAIDKYGKGSVQHLKAKLEYDEFLAKYVNQEADPIYYFKRNSLLRQLLEYNPRLAEAYYRLYYERIQIFDEINKDGYTPELHKKLSDVTAAMNGLSMRDVYYDRASKQYKERPELPEGFTLEGMNRLSNHTAIYNHHSANYLGAYLKLFRDLNDEYYEHDAAFGFEQQLNDNLKIIRDAEQTQPNGLPGVPLSQLQNNKEYLKAKKWIKENAKYGINYLNEDNPEVLAFRDKLEKAREHLRLDRMGRPSRVTTIVKEISTNKDIYDEFGILDATKLTEDELDSIRIAQNNYYGNRVGNDETGIPATSDRQLISNAHYGSETYNSNFYSHFSRGRAYNAEYFEVVTQINKILSKYYDNNLKRVLLEKIPRTRAGIEEIKQLGALYQKLRSLRKTEGGTVDTDWIKQNTETVTDAETVNAQLNIIKELARTSPEWGNAFVGTVEEPGVLFEHKDDGSFVYDKETNQLVWNRFLFTFIKLKESLPDSVKDAYRLKTTTEEMELINRVYRKVPTVYWYKALDAAEDRRRSDEQTVGKAEADRRYNEWLENQFIFNPYTRQKELLSCWVTTEFNTDALDNEILGYESVINPETGEEELKIITAGIWTPKSTQYTRVVKEDKQNEKFKKDLGILANYQKDGITGNDKDYNSNIELNEYEEKMKEYLQGLLLDSAKGNQKGTSFFKRGYAPISQKADKANARKLGKEMLKLGGIGVDMKGGKDPYFSEIGFGVDKTPNLPMTTKLGDATTAELRKQLEALHKPEREEFATDEEYNTKLDEYNTIKKEYQDKIEEIHRGLLNRDWYSVINEYLNQASRFNAIQDNKQKLFWLLNELKSMKMYERHFGSYGDLKKTGDKDNPTYIKSVDNELIEQLETYIHRLVYDQWKKQEGFMTKFANVLQSFTSANYMTLNVKGGVANVTLGATGMLSEAAAKEYFGRRDWGFGTKEWTTGALSYARRAWEENFGNGESRCYSKQDAVIEAFNVVDYDEHRGVVRDVSLSKVSEGIRNFTYSPQTMGEHFMQNSVLFAMLHSHRLVTLPDGEVTYMNETEYLRYREADILKTILSDEQRASLAEFKKNIKANKDTLKDYAWFRKDALTEWVILHCDKKQQKEFGKARREEEKNYRKEFREMQDMYSQLELGENGHMSFVAGSKLAELNEQYKLGTKITKANHLCGLFAERVRKTNNKIHGVYNREGAANIEKEWYGSLIMQYHKHLPIGLLKRYRARGLFNETRGSVEKGLLQSLIDFISLDFRSVKLQSQRNRGQVSENLTDSQLGAIQGLQMFALNAWKTIWNTTTTWNILPEYERQNIRRNLGDLVGTAFAFGALVGLWLLAGGDDELEDNLAWNFAIYEMDRLATEAFMYNPWGLGAETKKLMSTPVAAQSIVGDAINTITSTIDWMLTDDYDFTYQSGRFAGQNKLLVRLKRRIPLYSSIHSIFDLADSNHYYKVANSYSTVFGNPKKVAGVED